MPTATLRTLARAKVQLFLLLGGARRLVSTDGSAELPTRIGEYRLRGMGR